MKRPFKLYRFWVRTLSPSSPAYFTLPSRASKMCRERSGDPLATNHFAVIDDGIIPYSVRGWSASWVRPSISPARASRRLQKFFFTSAGVFPVDRSGGNSALGGLEAARRILDKGGCSASILRNAERTAGSTAGMRAWRVLPTDRCADHPHRHHRHEHRTADRHRLAEETSRVHPVQRAHPRAEKVPPAASPLRRSGG